MKLDKNHLLHKSKTFCILPWIHYHITSGGHMGLCCVGNHEDGNNCVGNINEQSFDTVWQSEEIQKVRAELINEIPQTGCTYCYDMDESGINSFRKRYNKKFAHHFHRVESTNAEGFAPLAKPIYWDIRFSNICNLSCRMCEHNLSSSWFDDGKAIAHYYTETPNTPILKNVEEAQRFHAEMDKHLLDIEEIYFAGGEPLMMSEHHHILERLISLGRTDVRLLYNTNMTHRYYKKHDIYALWNKFDNVTIQASIDSTGDRVEYIRNGCSWENIKKNRQELREAAPRVLFKMYPTVSIFNIFTLPEVHKVLVETGFISIDNFMISCLMYPEYLSIRLLPAPIKDEIRAKIKNHKEWIRSNTSDEMYVDIIKNWDSLLVFMKEDHSSQIEDFLYITEALDKRRGQNFRETFPELSELH